MELMDGYFLYGLKKNGSFGGCSNTGFSEKGGEKNPKPNPRLITKCRIRYADDVLLSEDRDGFACCWKLCRLHFCPSWTRESSGQSWLTGAKAADAWGERCRTDPSALYLTGSFPREEMETDEIP